eukprot:TRINITY_DN10295_c0_g1_i2.p1 TRINITY_DN10295_c0_g1~~TRINITY_DN10295_c0_g1_i2.p1  ORF type:complete len:203 (-),score=5.26 TRINITY_DN10295_c0_g1_i2:120-728(-)
MRRVPKEVSHAPQLEEKSRISDESTKALDRAIASAADATECGAQTLQTLHTQRDQLNRISGNLHEMEEDLTRTQWVLRGMSSFAGAFTNLFWKPTVQAPPPPQVAPTKQHVPSSVARRDRASSSNSSSGSQSSSTANLSEAEQKHLQQLDTLNDLVVAMKGTAHDIHDELERQSSMLEDIDRRVDRNIIKIQRQNKSMQKLI